MLGLVRKFASNKSGATAIENGLLYTLIGVAVIAGLSVLGPNLGGTFMSASDAMTMSDAGTPSPTESPNDQGGGEPPGPPTQTASAPVSYPSPPTSGKPSAAATGKGAMPVMGPPISAAISK